MWRRFEALLHITVVAHPLQRKGREQSLHCYHTMLYQRMQRHTSRQPRTGALEALAQAPPLSPDLALQSTESACHGRPLQPRPEAVSLVVAAEGAVSAHGGAEGGQTFRCAPALEQVLLPNARNALVERDIIAVLAGHSLAHVLQQTRVAVRVVDGLLLAPAESVRRSTFGKRLHRRHQCIEGERRGGATMMLQLLLSFLLFRVSVLFSSFRIISLAATHTTVAAPLHARQLQQPPQRRSVLLHHTRGTISRKLVARRVLEYRCNVREKAHKEFFRLLVQPRWWELLH